MSPRLGCEPMTSSVTAKCVSHSATVNSAVGIVFPSGVVLKMRLILSRIQWFFLLLPIQAAILDFWWLVDFFVRHSLKRSSLLRNCRKSRVLRLVCSPPVYNHNAHARTHTHTHTHQRNNSNNNNNVCQSLWQRSFYYP